MTHIRTAATDWDCEAQSEGPQDVTVEQRPVTFISSAGVHYATLRADGTLVVHDEAVYAAEMTRAL